MGSIPTSSSTDFITLSQNSSERERCSTEYLTIVNNFIKMSCEIIRNCDKLSVPLL